MFDAVAAIKQELLDARVRPNGSLPMPAAALFLIEKHRCGIQDLRQTDCLRMERSGLLWSIGIDWSRGQTLFHRSAKNFRRPSRPVPRSKRTRGNAAIVLVFF
ncbi:hypothetical protein Zmor_004608 [Zophobas morio]|uniref:Uncharacterized protein n=1 Tax=Zophobas morio TaxID=2755281 RepID=A0AA38IRQ2_9CUCU|nr:hypothetical protein Zmor_004608 [Zophobas morio]